ncbi:peptidoglycan-binding protein [Lyngbya aestuarii]|uniref:peptidoglycan-binding protein n=1 Tax=Lyngbya aestuarii TaxID=118322 RepID=UPI00403DB44F
MEILVYLHLALADENPTEPTPVLMLEVKKLFARLSEQKLASHARIYLLSLVVILGILGTAGEASAQELLKRGTKGSEVTEVQRRLRELRYFNEQPTGFFGEITENAVKKFQEDSGLLADGVVGEQTEAALFADSSVTQARQQQLQTFDTLPPPQIGGPTLASPGQVTWQSFNTLPPPQAYSEESITPFGDSNEYPNSDFREREYPVGEPIRKYRQTAPNYPTSVDEVVLRRGDRGPAVKKLQEELRRRGFNPGPIDGIFGSQTEVALRRFQRTYRLYGNGIADARTLAALGIYGVDEQNRYVVIVPVRDYETLSQVRQYIRNAFLASLLRGNYVNAGSFDNRYEAESLSYALRARGLDARVEYFQ